MTPMEVLEKVADRVERGWCQGRYRRAQGQGEEYCVMGAFIRTLCDSQGVTAGLLFYDDSMCEPHPAVCAVRKEVGGMDLVLWNDAPGRTKEEVVATIRNAKRWLDE